MIQKICEIEENQKNLNLEMILIKYLETKQTKNGDKIVTWLVADEGGSIEFAVWNCPMNTGDIIYLKDGYTSLYQGRKRLFVSKFGSIHRIRTFRKEFKISDEHKDLIKRAQKQQDNTQSAV